MPTQTITVRPEAAVHIDAQKERGHEHATTMLAHVLQDAHDDFRISEAAALSVTNAEGLRGAVALVHRCPPYSDAPEGYLEASLPAAVGEAAPVLLGVLRPHLERVARDVDRGHYWAAPYRPAPEAERPRPLSWFDADVLRALPVTPKELADRLGEGEENATRRLRTLQKRGLARRRRGAGEFALTPTGAEALAGPIIRRPRKKK